MVADHLDNFFPSGTVRMSFIKDSFEKIEIEFKKIIFQTFNKKWEEYEVVEPINEVLKDFNVRTYHEYIDVLIWQPVSIGFGWVVFFTNMPDGWRSALDIFFNKSKIDIITIEFTSDNADYPMYSFEYQNELNRRLVRSMKESNKWDFFEQGAIMEIEDMKNYQNRRIRDRMNRPIIIRYLKNIGINIEQSDFWIPKRAVRFSNDLQS